MCKQVCMNKINRRNIIHTFAGLGLSGVAGCLGSQKEEAQYNVVDWNLPDEIEIQEKFDFRVTVKNVGGETGRCIEPLYYTIFGDHVRVERLDFGDIEPGEKKEYLYNDFYFDYIGPRQFSLREHGDSSRLMYVRPANIQLGDKFTLPSGLTMSVDKYNIQSSITYLEGDEYLYDSNAAYIFAYIYVKNNTLSDWVNPLSNFAVSLLIDDEIDVKRNYPKYQNRIYWPSLKMFDNSDLSRGDEREGWIAFVFSGENRLKDLKFLWRQRSNPFQRIEVYWNLD